MLFLSEILTKTNKLKTVEEKIKCLKANDTYALRKLLYYMYNPNIQFFMPTIPDYKHNVMPLGVTEMNLYGVIQNISIFEKHTPGHFDSKKIKLIHTLQSLAKEEVEVFKKLWMRQLTIEGLSGKMVNDVFQLNIPYYARKEQ